jgi:alpha-D-ribose 1-methylphosphonate 5-triphosphate synthase subunit PhnL
LRKQFVLHTIDSRIVEALNGVSLKVSAGEHVALAGTSGAGKSSLLKSIYRTYKPTSGEVFLKLDDDSFVDLISLTDSELATLRGTQIGYVSQFLRAQPRRSTFEIVTKAGIQRGMDSDTAKQAAAYSLQRLNLDEALWDVSASMLSGGEKQRVNLAAGTISPPRLLLLDEPVSALDPVNRESALELIGTLTDQGVAVLAVFHDIDAMERLASRVIVLRNGVVDYEGSPKETLARLEGVAR